MTAAGGGYNDSSNPTITNCIFSQNTARIGGGGMYNATSSPAITSCTFSKNTAYYCGGMYNYNGSPAITNCIFFMNKGVYAGGMNNHSSSPAIINCTFSGNTGSTSGGGIYNFVSGNPTVTSCTFSMNTATKGGGMFSYDSSPTIINCTFSGNTATADGGGIYNDTSSLHLINCTFSGNIATIKGGGMYNILRGSAIVTNCILWNNSPDQISNDSSSTSLVTYSILEGDYTGTGNLDTDPLFVDSSSGIFRLQGTSPAIDAGDDAAVPAGVTTDLDGNPRIAGAAVNMGAYESLASGSPLLPVIPGLPLPIVITAEVSDITATGAASGGNVIYPEGCTALLVGRGVAWDTVSPPTYPEDSATFDGWTSGEYASALTNLVPQTKYYIRAYVQYKLHNVLYTRYSEYIYNFTTPAIPGDVNGDKVLDLKDAILALKIVAGAAGNAAINLSADVNEDAKIGVEEAVYVLQNVGNAE